MKNGEKAVIRLTKSGGRSSYTGSTRNGVTSSNYGSWTSSYTIALVNACSTSGTPEVSPPTTPTVTPAVDTGIPMKGFDYHYKVYGKTNSNDLYIARDPAAAGVPGVAGFYLIRNTNKDEPQFYNLEHPVSRASAAKAGFAREASYDLELRDVNEDGAQDLIITGLEDSALGRWDIIVYSSATTNGSPIGYKEMDRDFQNFFAELGKWIQDN